LCSNNSLKYIEKCGFLVLKQPSKTIVWRYDGNNKQKINILIIVSRFPSKYKRQQIRSNVKYKHFDSWLVSIVIIIKIVLPIPSPNLRQHNEIFGKYNLTTTIMVLYYVCIHFFKFIITLDSTVRQNINFKEIWNNSIN